MNIITIHRPTLTDEERAKRMEEIKQAATRLLVETAKRKQLKQMQQQKGKKES